MFSSHHQPDFQYDQLPIQSWRIGVLIPNTAGIQVTHPHMSSYSSVVKKLHFESNQVWIQLNDM